MMKISIAAVALGIIIMILALSTGLGLQREIKSKIIGFNGAVQILNYESKSIVNQSPVSLDKDLIEEIVNLNYVQRISPFAEKAGIIKNDSLFEGVVLKGITNDFDNDFYQSILIDGEYPKYNSNKRSDSVVISQILLKKLKLSIGDSFRMYFIRDTKKPPLVRNFIISGCFQTNFEAVDQNYIIGDIKHIQRINKWSKDQYGGYQLALTEESNLDIAQEIRLLLPFELDAVSAKSTYEQLFQWLDLFDVNMAVILVIILAVAALNMCIALLIMILDKTQLIGILKALGASNYTIQRIFLFNASILIFRALLIGNVIGIGIALLQKQTGFIKLDPSVYYVSEVSIFIDPFSILIVNISSLLICFLCMILPSLLITRISPVKAIRFD